MTSAIFYLSALGILLSIYSLYVDKRKSNDSGYVPACDMSKNISCSKAFQSKYGKIIGVKNYYFGILFYLAMLIFSYFNFWEYVFYLSILLVIGTFYLVYALYFKVKKLCLICNAIYVINLVIFLICLTKFF